MRVRLQRWVARLLAAAVAGAAVVSAMYWLLNGIGPYSVNLFGYGWSVESLRWTGLIAATVSLATLFAPRTTIGVLALAMPVLFAGNALVEGLSRQQPASPRNESCASSFADGQFRDFNVVLVSLDSLRADHLGYQGYAQPTSPWMDRLAAEGVWFPKAFSSAAATLMSHSTMFTGLQPGAHAAQLADKTALAESARTLTEYFRDSGYATGGFTGGTQLSRVFGFAQGFDTYYDSDGGLDTIWPLARRWMDGHQDKKFFLFLHTYAVHHPYKPPPPYDRMFDPEYKGHLPPHASLALLDRINGGHVRLTPDDLHHIASLYDGGIRFADTFVGELMRYLNDSAISDKTVIVLTSDHGEEFGEHGNVGLHSHTLFNELLHVPVIIKLPGVRPRRVPQTIGTVDLTPTILDLLQIPYDQTAMQGVTFAGMLSDAGCPATQRIVLAGLEHAADDERGRMMSVIAGNWKLILRAPSPEYEWFYRLLGSVFYPTRDKMLFDLKHDPGERHNVVSAHVSTARWLEDLIRQARDSDRQKALTPNPTAGVPLDEDQLERLKSLGYIK
jgi:arylsulfatase A-like enzyme